MLARIATRASALVLALTLAPQPGWSQTPPDQDHAAHHPPVAAPADKAGKTGMDCQGGMMGMGSGMGMMAKDPEAGIGEIKQKLGITDSQIPQWNRFADALRAAGKPGMPMQAMQGDMKKPLPDRLSAHRKMMEEHITSLKSIEDALAPLYAVLSDDQKKAADGLRLGPMGMMRGPERE